MKTQRCGSTPPALGPALCQDGVFFRVWAPRSKTVAVKRMGARDMPVALVPEQDGYFAGLALGFAAGVKYTYLLDGALERPDPASRCQPDGVHGPSQVIDPAAHVWQDMGWQGVPLKDFIIYELHVGTFSAAGTFQGVQERLDHLCELGITAVEIMPVAQFPGTRNWGYDGVYPFAVQTSYGGHPGLKRLVDACHLRGLAVILDVVCNHLGPEGNYLHAFGPYFTDRYKTPWGEAVNFDGPGSDGVRDYFVANALYWVEEFHIDALRLDAVHGIFDFSARHILDEIGEAVHRLGTRVGRQTYVVAESDLNDSRLIRSRAAGGYGLDAQWNDDFHHALHTLLTGERHGYYMDFGDFGQLVTAFREGYVYSGAFSRYRKRHHGNDAGDIAPSRFVVFSQNHDQVGNRRDGDRLAEHLDLAHLKLAAAAVLLSPFIPLLFMGEEYGETAPFQYFISHGDPALIEAVRRGRQEEFAPFAGEGQVPDPQDEATLQRSLIDLKLAQKGWHATLYRFYRRLIALRRECAWLGVLDREKCTVTSLDGKPLLLIAREEGNKRALTILNFGIASEAVNLHGPGHWEVILDSSAAEWGGPGSVQGALSNGNGVCYLASPLSVAILHNSRGRQEGGHMNPPG